MAENSIEIGVYLLTPTHLGSGQAAAAVDLPIIRESHTDYPLLPGTAIKGVLRQHASRTDPEITTTLFGTEPPQSGAPDTRATNPGALVFTDGHLLAFPVRSLQAAFYWVTCPWVMERWIRQRKAVGLDAPELQVSSLAPAATFTPRNNALVLENRLVEGVTEKEDLQAIGKEWSTLLPANEPQLQERFQSHLVSVPDELFADLVRRTTPVNARIQLTPGKTTDKWVDPDNGNKEYSGNLWYEETLPPDCLFSTLVTTRDGSDDPITGITLLFEEVTVAQIGGNETVGQGLATWTMKGDVS